MKDKKLLIGLPLASIIIYSLVIIITGLTDRIHPSDAAVVLGNKIEASGKVSDRLKSRLDRSILLYNKHIVKNIIVSGGVGKEGFDEAKVMKKYLIEKGLLAKDIIVDSHGNNTMQTASNAYSICEENNYSSVIIVSQYFHILRCKIAFHKAGFKDNQVGNAHALFFEMRDIYSVVRELVAVPKYLFY